MAYREISRVFGEQAFSQLLAVAGERGATRVTIDVSDVAAKTGADSYAAVARRIGGSDGGAQLVITPPTAAADGVFAFVLTDEAASVPCALVMECQAYAGDVLVKSQRWPFFVAESPSSGASGGPDPPAPPSWAQDLLDALQQIHSNLSPNALNLPHDSELRQLFAALCNMLHAAMDPAATKTILVPHIRDVVYQARAFAPRPHPR